MAVQVAAAQARVRRAVPHRVNATLGFTVFVGGLGQFALGPFLPVIASTWARASRC